MTRTLPPSLFFPRPKMHSALLYAHKTIPFTHLALQTETDCLAQHKDYSNPSTSIDIHPLQYHKPKQPTPNPSLFVFLFALFSDLRGLSISIKILTFNFCIKLWKPFKLDLPFKIVRSLVGKNRKVRTSWAINLHHRSLEVN